MWVLCAYMNVFSTWMDYIFLNLFLEKRKLKNRFVLLWLGIINTLYFVVSVFTEGVLYNLIADAVMILLVSVVFEVRDRQRVKLLLLLLVSGIVIDLVVDFTVNQMNLPQNLPMSGREIIYCASVVLENILRYLVVLTIAMNTKVKMVKRQNVIFELLYIPLVCLFILFGVICYVILAYRIQEKHLRYGMEIVACSVNLIVCVLSLKLNKMYCNRLHMNAYLQYMQIKDEYFHQIEAQQDEVRRIKHDLKNHMIYLQGLLATGEIKEAATYIKEVIGQDEIIGNTIFTANSAVNIILNAKQTRMQKEKLQFVYNIEMPGKLGIKEKDIVAIIGNILDNAIEAAKKCETPGTIELLVRYHASRLVIQCKNPTEDKEVRMVTGKQDKIHHGIGLRNVSRIAEWYEGIMTREIQDGKFVITISLLEDDSCKDGEWKMTAVQ